MQICLGNRRNIYVAGILLQLWPGVLCAEVLRDKVSYRSSPYAEWEYYTVQPGDTLSELFRRFVQEGLPARSRNEFYRQMMRVNPKIKDPDLIDASTMIRVPVRRPIPHVPKSPLRTAKVPEESARTYVYDYGYGSHDPVAFGLAPMAGYTRIDIKEISDGSTGTLLSKKNYGGVIIASSERPNHTTRFSFVTYEHQYEEVESTKPLDNDRARVHRARFDYIRRKAGWGMRKGLGVVHVESVYLSALDTTMLVLDPVPQMGLGIIAGYGFHGAETRFSLDINADYLSSAHASTFRVRRGFAGYLHESLALRMSEDSWFIQGSWYGVRNLESSISTQKTTDIGLFIGLQWR